MAGRAAGTPVVAWCCIDAFVRTVLRSRAAFLGYMDSPYAYPAPSPCRRHPLTPTRRHRPAAVTHSLAIVVATATLTATIAASTVAIAATHPLLLRAPPLRHRLSLSQAH